MGRIAGRTKRAKAFEGSLRLDFENAGLPMLVSFARHPGRPWETWNPACGDWLIWGRRFSDHAADALQKKVLSDLGALVDDPKWCPRKMTIAVQYENRGDVLLAVQDLDKYFQWVLFEIVRQSRHDSLVRCEVCDSIFLKSRKQWRLCGTEHCKKERDRQHSRASRKSLDSRARK